MYDVVFHLYASSPRTGEPVRFREDWGELLAFGDGQISTGGYAPSFLDTWWKTRVRTGGIDRVGVRLALTGSVRQAALEALGLA